MRTILIIDDNPGVLEALSLLFSLHDIQAITALSPEAGLEVLTREPVSLVIADMNFAADTTSGQEGAALFHAIRARNPDLPVILLTAWTQLAVAVELVKAGAADYLAKPWDDAKLLATVENLLELAEAAREATARRAERNRRREALAARFDLCGLVYAADATERVVTMACQIARSNAPVLITGPNGAGKERIAQIVHANSAVKAAAFIAVNCGALPTELAEAELFGAEAGAYTGSTRPREGHFETAEGGTLFLDEIGNLPLSVQVKLLRVLESGDYQRLGSSRVRKARVRVLSATNSELPQMIREGRFREDLYYRLNVIELNLPPLTERMDDVDPLAEHFLRDSGAVLSDEARELLHAHSWPGNVRELKNVLERARLFCQQGTIAPADLGLQVQPRAVARSLDDPSKEAIEAALAKAGGMVSRAAQSLGLSRQALYRRMERFGIAQPG
ncbi:sigma-54-dependent transcriptional regulator [Nevskia ramosa]|uniref:sigma-54-dependent transcriptional regulator n=1 Tax=Nevskia ramosa TaxID=64002 RepID=UPI0003B2E614|nr:sigma-54 dependent transcriptional regulator [Nevskia ramosa]